MFERYTDEARRVIFFAAIEAQHRNEKSISVRDILIALTRESPSSASGITRLNRLAVALRASVGIPHLPITSRPFKYESGSAIPLDKDSKKVIERASSEAHKDGEYWIDSDHLLRALLTFPNPAHDALLRFELNPDSLRRSSRQYRCEFPAPRAPRWARVKILANRYAYFLSLLIGLSFILLMGLLLVLVLKVRGPLR